MLKNTKPKISLETTTELSALDIVELCDATEEAIYAGGGFGWLNSPQRSTLKITGGVLIPDRILILTKLIML